MFRWDLKRQTPTVVAIREANRQETGRNARALHRTLPVDCSQQREQTCAGPRPLSDGPLVSFVALVVCKTVSRFARLGPVCFNSLLLHSPVINNFSFSLALPCRSLKNKCDNSFTRDKFTNAKKNHSLLIAPWSFVCCFLIGWQTSQLPDNVHISKPRWSWRKKKKREFWAVVLPTCFHFALSISISSSRDRGALPLLLAHFSLGFLYPFCALQSSKCHAHIVVALHLLDLFLVLSSDRSLSSSFFSYFSVAKTYFILSDPWVCCPVLLAIWRFQPSKGFSTWVAITKLLYQTIQLSANPCY